MICIRCNRRFPAQCVCPDRDERVRVLRKESSHVAVRVCRVCDLHADLCKCEDGPITVMESMGKQFPAPAECV